MKKQGLVNCFGNRACNLLSPTGLVACCYEPVDSLHPTPHTLHLSPCTLDPKPHTLHPTPYTLNRSPYTLHPAPYNLHHTAPHQIAGAAEEQMWVEYNGVPLKWHVPTDVLLEYQSIRAHRFGESGHFLTGKLTDLYHRRSMST